MTNMTSTEEKLGTITFEKMHEVLGGVKDLSNLDLEEVDLQNMVLENVNFEGSLLLDATFNNTTLINCTFENTNLNRADFTGATLENCTFTKTQLIMTKFNETSIKGGGFINCDFNKTDFDKATLDNIRFFGRVRHVNFTDTVMNEITFESKYVPSHIAFTSFKDAKILNLHIEGSLFDVDFTGALFLGKNLFNLVSARVIKGLTIEVVPMMGVGNYTYIKELKGKEVSFGHEVMSKEEFKKHAKKLYKELKGNIGTMFE